MIEEPGPLVAYVFRLIVLAATLALVGCGDGSSTSAGVELLAERSLVENDTYADFDQLVSVELEGVEARLHPFDSGDRGTDVIRYDARLSGSRGFSLELEGEHTVTVKVRDSVGNELASLDRDQSEAVARIGEGEVSIEISHSSADGKTLFLQPAGDRTRITSGAMAAQDLIVRTNSGMFVTADGLVVLNFGSVTLESGSFIQVEGPGSASITIQSLSAEDAQGFRFVGRDGKAGDTGAPGEPGDPGEPGENGWPGEPGDDGEAAPAGRVTIEQLSGSLGILTRGGHGGPGGNGGPGGDGGEAEEGSPDLPGGNGGLGGDGGNGGSGANVTVLYRNLNGASISTLHAESLGGEPGVGGDGGAVAGSPGESGDPGSPGSKGRIFVVQM